ncbi:nlpc/p60 superfamily protein [Raccoonpox virus]|uniref:Protein OPG091 n=1 Tax=Raccoon poxvirus TaxID=10256 RepID=A0A0G3FXP2_RACVI|nr:NLPc/P60 superfamily protein [Raccoonpox virus]AKJ93713.1 NLPc/P60 superfamily protein [Raccoonpox virus]AOP31345.1 nlpc/p60 superfamily protein [Raccoonpox virus]
MNPIDFIKQYAPRGSIIFINYNMSLTSHFNPSIEKHVGIYYGMVLSEHFVVESTYRKGVRLVTLDTFFEGYLSTKVYMLENIQVMKTAADTSLSLLGIPYGFGDDRMYCFKLVAGAYKNAGIEISSKRLLGKDIFLSQNFTDDDRWIKIYDSQNLSFW